MQVDKPSEFYKINKDDKVWWVDTDALGAFEFSFDQKKVYNLFRDFPEALSAEEVQTFVRENPYWAKFFSSRLKGMTPQ